MSMPANALQRRPLSAAGSLLALPLAAAISLMVSLTAVAAESGATAANPEDDLRKSLARVLPGAQIDRISRSPIAGVMEVAVGMKLYYVTDDGRYLLSGELYDLEERKNLSEEYTAGKRVELLAAVDPGELLIYSPEEVKHSVTIFTDIDCPYCRKLHDEMPDYHKRGIEVRYVLYPRARKGSESYDKAISVWCNKERKQALDLAKSGEEVEDLTCDHPIDRHVALGQQVGVRGTPAIVTSDGRMLPGYLPADRLLMELVE